MARKDERYKQVPTLWHIGVGMPCRVMRTHKGQNRWGNRLYEVLTYASALRWARLQNSGRATVRRDVVWEKALKTGIGTVPPLQKWATRDAIQDQEA